MPRRAPTGSRSPKMSPCLPTSVLMILFVTGGAGGSVRNEPRRCYWCGPLADQVHRSARAPSCPQHPGTFSIVTCELGMQHCAVVATARPYIESRLCVKLYQDECYQTYCNTTNTWKMICPCRGDLCNGPNTDREHEAFNILIKLSAKNKVKKRESGVIGNHSMQDLDNEKSTIQNDIEQTSESSIDAGTQKADAGSEEQSNASDVEQSDANREQNEASNDAQHVASVGAPDIENENDVSNIEQKNEASNDAQHVESVGAPDIENENDVSIIKEKNEASNVNENEETVVEGSTALNDVSNIEPVRASDIENDVSKVEQIDAPNVDKITSKAIKDVIQQTAQPHVDQVGVPDVQTTTPNDDVQNDLPIPDQIDMPDTKIDPVDNQPMESVESKQIIDENNHLVEETQNVQASNEIVTEKGNEVTTENTETKSNTEKTLVAVKTDSDGKSIGVTVSNMKSSESLPTAKALQQNVSPSPKTEKFNEISTTETTLPTDTSTISIDSTVGPTRGNNAKNICYSTILILVNTIGICLIA